ncbi:MAG: hypothetical protein WAU91_02150 [Desulfatitalea sp.]
MSASTEIFLEFFILSAGFWLIFGLFSILHIKGFIVRRYEIETQLSKTIYFSHYMPFIKQLPSFFRSGFYVVHLLNFVWFWRIVKFIKEKRPNVGYFDDIRGPEEVTRHFSKKEIQKAKIMAFLVIILVIHVAAFYIFKFIWPEHFQ